MGVICNNCHKPNHFAKCCRSRHVRFIEENSMGNPNDPYFINSLFTNEISVSQRNPYHITLSINSKNVDFLLDTGADTNILSFNSYKKLNLSLSSLKKSNHKLSTFSGEVLPTVGQCILSVTHNNRVYNVNFHIIDIPCRNIIGRNSCENLKLVKRVHNVQFHESVNVSQLVEYKDLFSGIGCLKDYECHLSMKPDAVPSIDACRRIPFSLLEQLKEELAMLEKDQIITKVEEPTEWVSSIVIASKKNGKLRLCIDPRKLNKAIMHPHYQFPTIDEIKSSLSGTQYFTTLDANKGFYMLKLDEASSKLCTFITPQGRYRFLRLPFGINAAPELFHSIMTNRFSDISGVQIMMDDFLIYGQTKEEHDFRLKQVLDRARELGIKFNKEKSNIFKSEVKYLGHIFSKDGVKVDENKVKAICSMPPPTNVTELQRFLGMVTYLGSYIENLSEKTSNLRMLLSKENEWSWQERHNIEFNVLKESITKAPVLTYYDQNKPITLSVDSSKDAMGAVICHDKHPIAYASASLSSCQQSYSQIEKELLAILFGCTKFHQYIYGRHTLVETDHKPIVSLYKKPIYNIPPRLQRIMLRLQPYDLNVIYKPGKYLYVADTLSRAALPEQSLHDLDSDLDLHVNLVIRSLSISPNKLKSIQEQTSQDKELSLLSKCCIEGWPEHKKLLPDILRSYFPLKTDIHIINSIVFKNNSVIIPVAMRNDILKQIHEGHQGIHSCQRLARNLVYWPNMYSDIEKYVNNCHSCLTNRRSNSKEPLLPHEVKPIPWNKVGVDLFDLNLHKYVIVVYYFSQYVELVKLVGGSTSKIVISHLKSIFSRHGIPNILISDNGPPFNSKEFHNFALDWQIQHITSSPYLPQSNGLVERTIGTVKNILKKCLTDNTDPHLALLQYRNTPKESMYSPAQLLMSRSLRTKLPVLEQTLKPKIPNYRSLINKTQIKKE
ncbi:unnamed protein product [Pieris macdunnoughi]|uniref:RNA-directed DNA polymerase n=1 Tax=Pieris macdunnoughi TaxID=345717 RepID=A0A821UKC1_9NEOP|nr:unnamed protein product [Pieris macdunnoughi]